MTKLGIDWKSFVFGILAVYLFRFLMGMLQAGSSKS